MICPPPRTATAFFLVGLALTILVSTAVTALAYGQLLPQPLLKAWLIAATHGLLFASFNHRAVGRNMTIFFRWGLVMNLVRIVVLLALIFLAQQAGMEHFDPFVVSTLIGYFCFLFSEVAHLARRNIKGDVN